MFASSSGNMKTQLIIRRLGLFACYREPMACTCTPGSVENNWFEDRCSDCVEEELDLWRDMMQRYYNRWSIRP